MRLMVCVMVLVLGTSGLSADLASNNSSADQAASASPLEEAWNRLPAERNANGDSNETAEALQTLQLSRSEVDQFMRDKLSSPLDEDPTGRKMESRFLRTGAVLRGNGARSCVWLVTSEQRLRTEGVYLAVFASGSALNYQEYWQFLDWLLRDCRKGWSESHFGEGGGFDFRLCDIAYRQLSERLKKMDVAVKAAERLGWKPAFEEIKGMTPYEQRDRWEENIAKLLEQPEVVMAVRALPSAISELRGKGQDDPMTQSAARWLKRMSVNLMSPETLKGTDASLDAVLDNWFRPLTEKDKANCRRLLGPMYTMENVASRFPQTLPCDRWGAAWAMFHRQDRGEVLKALIGLYAKKKGEESWQSYLNLKILELLGDLAVGPWRDDEFVKEKTVEFLTGQAKEAAQSWRLREAAQIAIKKIETANGGAKPAPPSTTGQR